MAKILVAGFLHETNTFCPNPTTFQDFEQPDAYPGLTLGPAIFDHFKKNNICLTGFIEEAQRLHHEIVPLAWCSAPPYGIVTAEAYNNIADLIIDGVRAHPDADGLFIDLHGAMVSEVSQDGEGELLKRIRQAIGSKLPIAITLDLHANISQEMFTHCDHMEVYRTYPHVDMFDSGVRAAIALDTLLENQSTNKKCFYKLPFLIPMPSQCTLIEPGKDIYRYLKELGEKFDCSLSCALGFPLADIFDCGPAVVGYGEKQENVDQACQTLAEFISNHKREFKLDVLPAKEAVTQAVDLAKSADLPIIIADTQDNPGGGGTSDTTGILRELLQAKAKNAYLALMHDPIAAEHAHAVGVGNEMVIELGDKNSAPGIEPLRGRFIVKALSDGRFEGTGPYYKNVPFDLGPMAHLQIEGIHILVSSRKMQAADQAIFRHLDIEPTSCDIMVLKSSVHFRADFAEIAGKILIGIAPGLCTADIRQLSYENLRSDLQLL
jgi:microcystin degradation protein MlrC